MNLSIITSFAVGGLLLLSILQMNFTVSSNSAQTAMHIVSKNRMQAVSETVKADFQRMGFGVAGPNVSDVITSINGSSGITFQSDLDDNGTTETISWQFTNTPYSASVNPNDTTLVRTVTSASGTETYNYPAVSFDLTYYDNNNTETTTVNNIDHVKIEIVCESPDPISTTSGNSEYARSFWQRTIVPPSVHIRNMQSTN